MIYLLLLGIPALAIAATPKIRLWRWRRTTRQSALKWAKAGIDAADEGDRTAAFGHFKRAAEVYLRAHLNIRKLDVVDIALAKGLIDEWLGREFRWVQRCRDHSIGRGVTPTSGDLARAVRLVEAMRRGTEWGKSDAD